MVDLINAEFDIDFKTTISRQAYIKISLVTTHNDLLENLCSDMKVKIDLRN